MIDDERELGSDGAAEDEALPKAEDATAWLRVIEQAEKVFEAYQDKADNIDELYGDLEKLGNINRDRDFQLFWANIQVLAPSIYARPPVPVVVPKFSDNKPVLETTSEVLERCTVVSFDLSAINEVMLGLRDDLAILSRGVPWVRYENKNGKERVCIEHKDRKDFLHEPARQWPDVGWVAGRAWLTKDEMKARFSDTSGDAYENAEYSIQKDDKQNGADDGLKKAGVWEIWSKTENRVIWITPGVEEVLDSDEPHLNLEGFFPCPKPAYGTLRRRSLIPIPDMVYYKDQLEEIKGLTKRIHALSEAVKVKGFYPSAGEQGDAIETAMKLKDDGKIMVPVSNWAAFGENGAPIIWLPVDMIVTTITALVALRKQVIEDVYQIMGLSDIMRGSTEASETATAQSIKAQYGSVRIRDKQQELVRVARDLARISAEIIAENFSQKTIEEMCQMELPTAAAIKKQIKDIEDGAKKQLEAKAKEVAEQAKSNPELAQQAQQNPDQAQAAFAQMQEQITQQAQQQIEKLSATVTIDQVMEVLRDQRIRPFTLDIETDSTIQPDEQAEKEARNEFMGVFTQTAAALGQLVGSAPEAAPLAGAMLKFVLAPYRAGRELNGKIDAFVEALEAKAGQPQPNPQAEQAEAEAKRHDKEMELKQADFQLREQDMVFKAQAEERRNEAEMAVKTQEAQLKQAETAQRMQLAEQQAQRDAQKHQQDMEKGAWEIERLREDTAFKAADKERMQRESLVIPVSAGQNEAQSF
ncbi:hypothetical protein [Brucella intermedia]|uniref:hypothetical protein n=1 Tax=Brucella intermedia TaxID=94625 RepID=UPI00124EDB19|nr:hypothetical protein [Brucella intermedia]KAB2733622.1 hypothetical protein F9L02_01195 [Brucella intermedia]